VAQIISRVTNPGALGRVVAVKTPLHAAFAGSLSHEVRALAALQSSAFVSVFCMAREGDVELAVMERLFGETVEARLSECRRRGDPMPIPEALRILSGIASALSIAHSRGVAHRDLKPANIFLAGERVVLVDLGIFVPEVLVGPDNEVPGSPRYMAPEVIVGNVTKGKGSLVDLYALGIIAFELLTNETPFAGSHLQRTLVHHVFSPFPDIRKRRSDIPPVLAALVTELTAKEPADRPSSAESVVWQLAELRAADSAPRRTLKVLAIDDEPEVGQALKRSLECAFPRLQVDATSDTEAATDGAPDIVLVDLHMPRESGIEVCMRLRSLPVHRRPVVVAMSAQATEADVAVFRALGVCHFVRKDVDFLDSMSAVIASLRTQAGSALVL
jgi:serine/threonine-protein kinase